MKQHLVDLGARLEGGKVVGPDGRELYFYRLRPTTGTARVGPKDEHTEIQELEEQGFRVILTYPEPPRYPPI